MKIKIFTKKKCIVCKEKKYWAFKTALGDYICDLNCYDKFLMGEFDECKYCGNTDIERRIMIGNNYFCNHKCCKAWIENGKQPRNKGQMAEI